MTEFGNLALIDQDAGEENGVAVPLPGVRKGEQKSPALSPTHFLGCSLHWRSTCFYIGTFFWNLECLGCFKGEGPHTFVPQDQCQGPPRQTMPVTVAQEAGVPLCRLPLDQSDSLRLSRGLWARRAVCWPADALKSVCS